MSAPQIGRVVHVVTTDHRDDEPRPLCLPALVVEADETGIVAHVFGRWGSQSAFDVPHSQEPVIGTWHWPCEPRTPDRPDFTANQED